MAQLGFFLPPFWGTLIQDSLPTEQPVNLVRAPKNCQTLEDWGRPWEVVSEADGRDLEVADDAGGADDEDGEVAVAGEEAFDLARAWHRQVGSDAHQPSSKGTIDQKKV